MMQISHRIKNKIFKNAANALLVAFIAFMVLGRILSGVHWITDIIGGALFSGGLVMLYEGLLRCVIRKAQKVKTSTH
jgi:undecaprenyl-diphosphatase